MKQIFCALALVFCVFGFSCSGDGPADPADDCSIESYAMLRTGNYWIYERHETDSSRRGRFESTAIDSTVVEGTRMILGEQAYMLVSHGSDATTDTLYVRAEKSALFVPASALTMFGAIGCDCLIPRWARIADCSRASWTSLDTAFFTSESYPTRTENGEFFLSFVAIKSSISGNRGAAFSFTGNGQNIAARRFELNSAARYSIHCDKSSFDGSPSWITAPQKHALVLGENTGIVEWRSESALWYERDTTVGNCDIQFIENESLVGKKIRNRKLLRWSVK